MPKKSQGERVASRAKRADVRRGRRSGPATPLSRDLIVHTALDLVDRDGLAALSMRRLGAALGVDPMAIYYHLPNKEALLDAIVEAVMAEIDLSLDDPSAPAEERVLWAARAYRDAMLAHANALPIVLSRGPNTREAMRPVELLIGIFRDAGLPPAESMAAMNTVAAAVRGLVGMAAGNPDHAGPPAPAEIEALAERFPADEFPHLREAFMCSPTFLEIDFDFGMRALARGLLAGVG